MKSKKEKARPRFIVLTALLAEGLRNKCRMLGAEAVFDTTTQFQDFLGMMSSEKDAR